MFLIFFDSNDDAVVVPIQNKLHLEISISKITFHSRWTKEKTIKFSSLEILKG
jgi:hypothetical protein